MQLPRRRDAVADAQISKMLPAVERPKGMVGRRDDAFALRGAQLEHRLSPVAQHALGGARYQSPGRVERMNEKRTRTCEQILDRRPLSRQRVDDDRLPTTHLLNP